MELERKEKDQRPMIKSIFVQDIIMKDFMIIRSNFQDSYYVTSNKISTGEIEVLYECLLPIKLIENEIFYIKQLDKCIEVNRYIINEDGSITYYIEEEKVINKYKNEPAWMKLICGKLNNEIDKYENSRRLIDDIKTILAEKGWKSSKLKRIKKKLYR